MDVDIALWVLLAGMIAFIGCGCMATRKVPRTDGKAGASSCGPSCATRVVY